ncbi:hypothetical protein GCM10009547_26530 [Sporichthya brevicatena]|uniref:Uncharacterized protein n=1 Tax=Sporichthya brevicatena TaxID=171442 RepID=A0ABN1GXN1_9ACTN
MVRSTDPDGEEKVPSDMPGPGGLLAYRPDLGVRRAVSAPSPSADFAEQVFTNGAQGQPGPAHDASDPAFGS